MSKRALSSAFSSPTKSSKSNSASNGSQRNFSQFSSSGQSGASSYSASDGGFLGLGSQAFSPSRRLVGSRQNIHANGTANSAPVAGPSLDNLLVVEKQVNDPIHIQVGLDKLSVRIIDTPEYQRLRHLKQLGTCSYVWPTAGHTRFEHSLGVAHLSERMCKTLQQNQPEIGITNVDILAVKIAGLCHDLGHGPFSHVYDGVFIPKMYPDKSHGWRHEDGSVNMFRYILKTHNIDLGQYGLSPLDQTFIEEIIGGEPESSRTGRAPDKFYLYDVVNNTRSGFDVDKLDYFQRDMRYTNVTFAANFERFITLGRVIRAEPVEQKDGSRYGTSFKRHHSGGWITSQDGDKDGAPSPASASQDNAQQKSDDGVYQLMVCYPQKLVFEAFDMFSVRFRMHKTVYTHKAAKQIEYMITDILEKADEYIKIKGARSERFPDGLYKISECICDMEALSNLNDSVIEAIRYDQNPKLAPAKAILKRMEQRQLYVCLGKSAYTREEMEKKGGKKSEHLITQEIVNISKKLASGFYEGTRAADANSGCDQSNDFINSDLELLEGEQKHTEYTDLEPCGNSQDSFYSVAQAQNSQGEPLYSELDANDIIVEHMHIHYGQKQHNPVTRMRFFEKHDDTDTIGRPIKPHVYQTSCPSVFEEMAVRVFCRTVGREGTARKAFQLWCAENKCTTPFQSQPAGYELQETEGFVSQV